MGKYEKALEQARKFYNDCVKGDNPIQAQRYVDIFPELKESEDERIRKALLRCCDDWEKGQFGCMAKEDVSAIRTYLEKQKEHKPNVELVQKSWYLEGYHDGKYNNEPKWLIQTGKGGPRYEENPKYGTQNPAEWSEEDEKMRDRILEILNKYGNIPVSSGKVQLRFNKEYMWLRHLYERFSPQPHWKPSEKQINMLKAIVEREKEKPLYGIDGYSPAAVLESLYDDLQKLL